MIEDTELKMRYAKKKPYGEYLKKNSVELKERPQVTNLLSQHSSIVSYPIDRIFFLG